MIIASIVFKLQAVNSAHLPVSHGRLLHAAVLDLVRSRSNEASTVMHDSVTKNFSVSLLKLNKEVFNNTYYLQGGDIAWLRVGVVGEEFIKILLSIPAGLEIRVGSVEFVIERVISDQSKHRDAGVTTLEALEAGCKEMPVMSSLSMDFLTPTTFKFYDAEYPFPRTELVFGSLAKRWNSFSEGTTFDVEKVKEIALYLIPENWVGTSKRVNVTPQRGMTGFTGKFTYSLKLLPPEYRYIFILLAEFAVFLGVGRLTGQGWGRVKIWYK